MKGEQRQQYWIRPGTNLVPCLQLHLKRYAHKIIQESEKHKKILLQSIPPALKSSPIVCNVVFNPS